MLELDITTFIKVLYEIKTRFILIYISLFLFTGRKRQTSVKDAAEDFIT